MQYGVEIFPYQRIKKVDKDKSKKRKISLSLGIFFYFIGAILTSRVILINLMAPFGLAFLLAAMFQNNYKISVVVACGTVLGYLSLYNNVKNLGAYFIIIGTLLALDNVLNKMEKKKKLIMFFFIIFLEFSLYKLFIMNLSQIISFSTSFFETVCIFPIYFIIEHSIICFKQFRTKHLYRNEEIISMAITISFIVGGSWGARIFNFSIRNIMALTFIVIIAYIKGFTTASACGIAMGTILGISSNDIIIFTSIYGLCGLVSGIFKDMGKWITGISYIITFGIIKMYSNIKIPFNLIEVIIACGIFFIIPSFLYNKLKIELDWKLKENYLKDNYIDKIKNMFSSKLNDFSQVLLNMSETLENLADNEKLAMKNKSSGLIENLADRVCGNCNMNTICWKRELFYTYKAFGELIQNYEENRNKIPYELDRKCVKRSMLVKTTETIVNNYMINEMWRSRISEGRQVLAEQINNIANSINEITDDFNSNIVFNNDIENNLRRLLNKNNIRYMDIFGFNNKKNRLIVKLSMKVCGGKQICMKKILPLLNQVTSKNMCVSDNGCNIDANKKICNITFEETPRYHIVSSANGLCKDGEKYSGDSYSFRKLGDGTYMTIISDGMGSGSQAGEESGAVVELIECFTKAGFSKSTAINSINSIMTIKFSQDEKFSTVDLSSIDLYSGKIKFMKVGAVPSFIKRDEEVEVINSKTLPIGILDKVDVDIIDKQVKNGDIIVMLSDGVLDYDNDNAGKVDWVVSYLKETENNDPEKLSEEIIQKGKELSGGKIKDDMTVVVSKVYGLN